MCQLYHPIFITILKKLEYSCFAVSASFPEILLYNTSLSNIFVNNFSYFSGKSAKWFGKRQNKHLAHRELMSVFSWCGWRELQGTALLLLWNCKFVSVPFLDDGNILMSCLIVKPKSTSLTILWLLVSVTSTLSKAYVVHAASRVSFLMNFTQVILTAPLIFPLEMGSLVCLIERWSKTN